MGKQSVVTPENKSSISTVSSGILQRKCDCGKGAGLSGKCEDCGEKPLTLQRKAMGNGQGKSSPLPLHDFLRPRQGKMPLLQPKLKIGAPNDKYEKEADRVAEKVMRMPEPQVQRQMDLEDEDEGTVQTKSIAGQITPLVQRQMEPEAEDIIQPERLESQGASLVQREMADGEEGVVQPKGMLDQATPVTPDVANRIQSLKGRGQPLSKKTRNFFEPRFGYDFSKVRVDTDWETTFATSAHAYTVGTNIVFSPEHYAPDTNKGKRLLAHELTHVIQQERDRIPKNSLSTQPNQESPKDTGSNAKVNFSAKFGQPQFEIENGEEDRPQAIPKENGRVAIVLVKNGVTRGYAEIIPPKGMSAKEAADQINLGVISTGEIPQVDVLLPSDWGQQPVNKNAPIQILDKEALRRQQLQQERAAEVQSLRNKLTRYFRWADQTQGTYRAPNLEFELLSMNYDKLREYANHIVNQPHYIEFENFQFQKEYDDAIRRQLLPEEIAAGITVADVKRLHDTTPERPPVRREVSGYAGTRYTTEAETGLQYNQKVRHNGETYGYYQRWHVYIPGKGLFLREVVVDLDGYILHKEKDRRITATHETVIDDLLLPLEITPFAGDALELAEIGYGAATGLDRWRRPISRGELGIRAALAILPTAIPSVAARISSKGLKKAVQQSPRVISNADRAKFLAQQAKVRGLRSATDRAEFLAQQAKVRGLRSAGKSPGRNSLPRHTFDSPSPSGRVATPQKNSGKVVQQDQSLAKRSTVGGHEIDVTKKGIKLCSPPPCPFLRDVYSAELAKRKDLREKLETAEAIAISNPKASAEQARLIEIELRSIAAANTNRPSNHLFREGYTLRKVKYEDFKGSDFVGPKNLDNNIIYEFEDGLRTWRKKEGGKVVSEGLVGPSIGREKSYNFQNYLKTRPGMENAHGFAQSFGSEGPLDIFAAKTAFNQAIENSGIEKFERMMYKVVREVPLDNGKPGKLLRTVITTPKSTKNYLKASSELQERTFKMDIVYSDGSTRSLYEISCRLDKNGKWDNEFFLENSTVSNHPDAQLLFQEVMSRSPSDVPVSLRILDYE